MKFNVFFCGMNGSYLVSSKSTQIGLKSLNQVREQLGVNIDARLLDGTKYRSQEFGINYELTEQQAINSGVFSEINDVHVKVSKEIMETCIIEELKVQRNGTTDAIESVKIIEKVSPEKLFETWQNYGYSLVLPIPTATDDEESEA